MCSLIKPEYKAQARILSSEIKAAARQPAVPESRPDKSRKSEFKSQVKVSRG